ncbi:MAG: hypothetical protein ACRBCK_06955 [Alphaproteobacteria bacterium]
MAKDTIGGKITLKVEFETDADKFLKPEIDYFKKGASIGDKEKTFGMGDNNVGRVEGHKTLTGKWKVNGLSEAVENMSWTFPRVDVSEVTGEMARRLAVLSSDVKDMSKSLKNHHNIASGQVTKATLDDGEYTYNIIDNTPG